MFTNTGSSVHDLVIVVAFMGALFSRVCRNDHLGTQGRQARWRFLVGGLLGALGVFILAAATPRQAEIDSAARSAGLTPVPTARSASKARRGCAGTVSVTSGPRPTPL